MGQEQVYTVGEKGKGGITGILVRISKDRGT